MVCPSYLHKVTVNNSWDMTDGAIYGNNGPDKRAAGIKRPEDPITERVDQREKRTLLPLIKKAVGRDTGSRNRNPVRFPENAPSQRPSQKPVKNKPKAFPAEEVTPWVLPSPSESSLTELLSSITPPRPCSRDLLRNPEDPKSRLVQEISRQQTLLSELQLLRDKSTNRAQPRARTSIMKRRTLNKLHSMKLPPVPQVTELSFSRNFSFSFFELPEHQSLQHWLQRQRVVYMTMRQLYC